MLRRRRRAAVDEDLARRRRQDQHDDRALGALTLIFFFQNALVRRPNVYAWVRRGYLLFILVWLGWYANAQLSVVNVLTFANSLLTGFSWEYFLSAPLIFLLWASIAAGLLFWGRGPFCGWLCPFGALQELLNNIAQAVKIPQYRLPWGLHERLWPIKYIIFLGLFGMSLYSTAFAEQLAEVEPFKTAIVLKFAREWPFVIYALTTACPRACSSSGSSAATCARSAPRSRFPAASGCSNGCAAGPNAARPASAAPRNARCRRSTPRGTSTSMSASTACIARNCISTTTAART